MVTPSTTAFDYERSKFKILRWAPAWVLIFQCVTVNGLKVTLLYVVHNFLLSCNTQKRDSL